MEQEIFEARLRQIRIAEREEALRVSRWNRWRKLVHTGLVVLMVIMGHPALERAVSWTFGGVP